MSRRIITTELVEEDIKIENNLRPKTLEDYIGQTKAKETLKIYIEAAKQRDEAVRSCPFLRTAGVGQNDIGRDYCQ